MKNIFIINGAHTFSHSGGRFNETLANQTRQFFESRNGYNVKTTHVGDEYDTKEEVEKFVWADLIVYHTPVWWFQVPFGFKKYLDEVFTEGYNNGIYNSDGRDDINPAINYGTGGTMHGKKYLLTTSWNAPTTAFTMEGEFFGQTSVDDGPLFGFHKMNAFVGLECLGTHHIHDIMKRADVPKELAEYNKFLNETFEQEERLIANFE